MLNRTTRQPRRTTLNVESLEDRSLMAVASFFTIPVLGGSHDVQVQEHINPRKGTEIVKVTLPAGYQLSKPAEFTLRKGFSGASTSLQSLFQTGLISSPRLTSVHAKPIEILTFQWGVTNPVTHL
jgi:hypothetical protein